MRLIDRAIAVDRRVDSPSRGRVIVVVPSVANPRRRASRSSVARRPSSSVVVAVCRAGRRRYAVTRTPERRV
jgi:hypothetical protein